MDKNEIILKEKNFNKLKNAVKKAKSENKIIIYSSEDDDLNRKVMEKSDIDIILIDQSKRKDFQKQRNSGFNQVMAKIAKKRNIIMGINLDEIIETNLSKEKSEIMARIKQNIFLCKKNNLKMKFIIQKEKNERQKHLLNSFGLILGMPTSMTKTL